MQKIREAHDVVPSMGPRLVGRGKIVNPDIIQTGIAAFNGAASCGTRKAVDRSSTEGLILAPSMGPRLVGRGKFSDKVDKEEERNLQWGRVLWDAERSRVHDIVDWLLSLQWGRVLWDAERGGRDRPWLSTVALQWGRVLWDAERPLP